MGWMKFTFRSIAFLLGGTLSGQAPGALQVAAGQSCALPGNPDDGSGARTPGAFDASADLPNLRWAKGFGFVGGPAPSLAHGLQLGEVRRRTDAPHLVSAAGCATSARDTRDPGAPARSTSSHLLAEPPLKAKGHSTRGAWPRVDAFGALPSSHL